MTVAMIDVPDMVRLKMNGCGVVPSRRMTIQPSPTCCAAIDFSHDYSCQSGCGRGQRDHSSRTGSRSLAGGWLLVCFVVMAVLLGGCASVGAGLLGKRQVQVSQEQLLAQMLRFKPDNMRWLNRLNVTLSQPRLTLDASTNRIRTAWDLELKQGLLTTLLKQQPFKQTVGVSTELAFRSETSSIVLTQVRLDGDFATVLGGKLSPEYSQWIGQFIHLAIEEGLEQYPVYTFDKEQLRYAGVNWIVEDIKVQEHGLSVGVAPE